MVVPVVETLICVTRLACRKEVLSILLMYIALAVYEANPEYLSF